jgi:ribose transport system substrate-binding protein
MKKTLSILLVLAALLSLGVCKNKSAPASDGPSRPTGGNGKIGFSTITLGSEFFSNLDSMVHKRLGDAGYEVITVSCEFNAAKQVSDIENLVSMNCEAIFFFAMDVEGLKDVLKQARSQSIKVYGIACTIDDPEAYDKILNTDQRASGVGAAQLMTDWVNAVFPGVPNGSVEIAVIVTTGTPDSNRRSEGELTVAELCPRVKVVESFDLSGAMDSNIKAQEFAEIMQGKYPNLKGVITYGADASLGVNEVYMRDAALNRNEFAIFGVDTSQVVYQEIKKSETNSSLIRGTVSLGDDLSLDVWECLIDADLQYMDAGKNIFKPVKPITKDIIDDYLN